MPVDIKIAIIRPIGIPIAHNFYNSQEIGLARGLSNHGVSVDVYVAGQGSKVTCRNIKVEGSGIVHLFEIPFIKIPLIDHAIYPQLIGLLADGKYDFIQVNEENEITSFWVARYAKKHGIPVVVYQGMYKQLTGRVYATFQFLYDKLLLPHFIDYLHLALVKSNRAGQHLTRKGFTKIITLPVGLDPLPFNKQNNRNWREECSIPEGDDIILYIGVFETRRNVDFMIDLAKELISSGVILVMAGSGPEHARISQRVKVEHLNNVRLVGMIKQEDIPSLYKASSLFLLPSEYEIYGMVVIESMFFGVPVISTRTAGPEDIITHLANGILLDGINRDQWVETIKELIENKDKRRMMGENAASKIRTSLTWDEISKEYISKVIIPTVTGIS